MNIYKVIGIAAVCLILLGFCAGRVSKSEPLVTVTVTVPEPAAPDAAGEFEIVMEVFNEGRLAAAAGRRPTYPSRKECEDDLTGRLAAEISAMTAHFKSLMSGVEVKVGCFPTGQPA